MDDSHMFFERCFAKTTHRFSEGQNWNDRRDEKRSASPKNRTTSEKETDRRFNQKEKVLAFSSTVFTCAAGGTEKHDTILIDVFFTVPIHCSPRIQRLRSVRFSALKKMTRNIDRLLRLLCFSTSLFSVTRSFFSSFSLSLCSLRVGIAKHCFCSLSYQ